MALGIPGRSDAWVPDIKQMHDETQSEARNEEDHNAIEEQTGNEVDNAQAGEALE